MIFRSRVAGALLFGLIVLGALVAFAGTASAFHHPTTGIRLNILTACPSSSTTFPANTNFWVRHGWAFSDWSQASKNEQMAFKDDTTRFDLLVDGSLVKSNRDTNYVVSTDIYFKSFLTNFPGGLTGTHVFTGRWYLDGSLAGGTRGEAVFQFECVVVATFV